MWYILCRGIPCGRHYSGAYYVPYVKRNVLYVATSIFIYKIKNDLTYFSSWDAGCFMNSFRTIYAIDFKIGHLTSVESIGF